MTVVKEPVKYTNVGPCPVCGCNLPDGKCITTSLLESYDKVAAATLREKGYEFDSDVGTHFALLNLPLVLKLKEEEEERKARKALNPPASSSGYSSVSGSNAYIKTYTSKGQTVNDATYYQPIGLLSVYALKWMCDEYPSESLESKEWNRMLNSFYNDMTNTADFTKYFGQSIDKNQAMFSMLLKGTDKNSAWKSSVWMFEVKEKKLYIINIFAYAGGQDISTWSFEIFR